MAVDRGDAARTAFGTPPDFDLAIPGRSTAIVPTGPSAHASPPSGHITYSAKDAVWAKRIERRLRSFQLPADLVGSKTPRGPAPETLGAITRSPEIKGDGDGDAPQHSALDAETAARIDAVDTLIVICSPDAAISERVNAEIKRFRARQPERPVAPVLVRVGDAGVDASYPLALRYEITSDGELAARPMEVIAADMREQADGRELATAKIAAAMLGVGADEIFQRTQRRERRRQRFWITGLAAAAAVGTLAAAAAEMGRRAASQHADVVEAVALAARAEAASARNAECALSLSLAALAAAEQSDAPGRVGYENAVRKMLARARATAILPGAAADSGPAWRPDSDALGFIRADGAPQVWAEGAGAPRAFGAAPAVAADPAAGAATGMAWSPRGDKTAILREGAVDIWSADGATRLARFEAPGVVDVAIAPGGDVAVFAIADQGLVPADLESQTLGAPLAAGAAARSAPASWSPGGDQLAAPAGPRALGVYDAPRDRGDAGLSFGGPRATLAHPAAVRAADWSPRGDAVASGLENGQVWIWDPRGPRRVQALDAHDGIVTAVAFSPDGARLLTAGADGRLKIWDAVSWRLESTLAAGAAASDQQAGATDRTPLRVSWRSDGARVASVGADGAVRVFAAEDGRVIETWAQRDGWVWNVEWPGEGARLVAATDRQIIARDRPGAAPRRLALSEQYLDGAAAVDAALYAFLDAETLSIADLDADRLIFQEPLGTDVGQPLAIALAPDGSLAAVTSFSGVFIYGVPEHQRISVIATPAAAATFSPDARRIALAGVGGGPIDIVDVATGEPLAQLERPAPPSADAAGLTALEWSRRGDRLAAAGDDGSVYVWRIDDPADPLILSGHLGSVKDVAWARGDGRLASAALDGTVRIWEPNDGTLVAAVDAHDAGVRSVAWSADGLLLATGGEDGRARLFPTEFSDVRRRAEAQAAAGLTPEERALCLGA